MRPFIAIHFSPCLNLFLKTSDLTPDDIYWQSEDDNTYKMYGIHARWGGAGWHGGVPLNLDAVFDFDGSTIFAKKDLYYRYNDYIHKVLL